MVAVSSPQTTRVVALDLDTIYREHVEYVWATLRRLGVAAADLEDVTHEVFVTVHRRLCDFDADRQMRPWIFGIALRIASRYRRRARRVREVSDEQLSAIGDDRRGADEALAERDARRIVFDALDRLSEEQRAVFVLHELEGCSVPQIALQLGVPLNTVYSRLRVARERFIAAATRAKEASR